MTRAQRNALDSARYLAGQSLLATTDGDREELAQLAGEWLAVAAGRPVKVTAETVHGLIAQLSGSGVME